MEVITMNNYAGSIDTDMAIGSILSNFDSTWVIHSVSDSLDMRFRPFATEPMPNFADIINRQFSLTLAASPDYADQVIATRDETFREIITTITDYYNLEFLGLETIGSEELFGIAHTMYDIFISRFTNYMVDFYTGYIMKNIDSIYAYLYNDDNVKKPREKDMPVKSYIDPKFQLIHANLNTVILNTAAYDISLEDLLFSFTDNNIATRLLSVLSDKGDIYKNYYASFLLDQRYMAELLTSIKLKLQELTQQAIEIK
jgi:hypothetical protein